MRKFLKIYYALFGMVLEKYHGIRFENVLSVPSLTQVDWCI